MGAKRLAILGTRGVPAAHGGFETFAEKLSLYLVGRGWDVTVYCQTISSVSSIQIDVWNGVRRVIVPVAQDAAIGTMIFDWRSILHAIGDKQKLVLTLGYNTALFCFPFRLFGTYNIMNMDGIEWKRDKWQPHQRAWLRLNERCGTWFANHLVADHPEIANHLAQYVSRDKITTIPYGAVEIREANVNQLDKLELEPKRFMTVIARPEPENSILEIVKAFSRKKRNIKLVMLGNYQPDSNRFHKTVLDSASDEIVFPGAIYNPSITQALRYYSRLYVHGHRVGGTNPSLVEALGAGTAVLAHDNPFNRWVAGDASAYFIDEEQCADQIDRLIKDDLLIENMKASSLARFQAEFTWPQVLSAYEALLLNA